MFTIFVNIRQIIYLCTTQFKIMEITFDKTYLSDLYYNAVTKDKKHRYQPQIVRKYIRVIDMLRAANSTDDLLKFNGLNYEVLKGDRAGLESVRVNDQFRIEFKTAKVVNEVIITVCNIIELSNHYK